MEDKFDIDAAFVQPHYSAPIFERVSGTALSDKL